MTAAECRSGQRSGSNVLHRGAGFVPIVVSVAVQASVSTPQGMSMAWVAPAASRGFEYFPDQYGNRANIREEPIATF